MDRRHPDYGKGEIEIDPSEMEPDAQELVDRLLTNFNSPAYRPPLLPTVALELLQLSRNQEVEFKSIRALLEKEPLMAARILRIAQSALFQTAEPVRSLDAALTRLGLSTLLDVFLETAVTMKVFRAKGFDEPMNRLRRHSTAVAYTARIICRHTAIYDEYAFLCGLLHDVGMAAAMIALTDMNKGKPAQNFDLAWMAIARVHEEAAYILTKAWQLPVELQLVLRNHHHPEIGGRMHPLAGAVCVADAIADDLKAGMGDEVDPSTVTRAEAALGLTDPVKKAVIEEGEKSAPTNRTVGTVSPR